MRKKVNISIILQNNKKVENSHLGSFKKFSILYLDNLWKFKLLL